MDRRIKEEIVKLKMVKENCEYDYDYNFVNFKYVPKTEYKETFHDLRERGLNLMTTHKFYYLNSDTNELKIASFNNENGDNTLEANKFYDSHNVFAYEISYSGGLVLEHYLVSSEFKNLTHGLIFDSMICADFISIEQSGMYGFKRSINVVSEKLHGVSKLHRDGDYGLHITDVNDGKSIKRFTNKRKANQELGKLLNETSVRDITLFFAK